MTKGSGRPLGFSFNVSRCSGCMACVVACMDQNDLQGYDQAFRRVTRLEKGKYPAVRIGFLSLACLHCGDAPCIGACPTGALFRRGEDGIVNTHPDLCIGCRSCFLACPFGAPRFLDNGKMAKCDFCVTRVEEGLEPACVRVCPTRALGFGPLEDLAREKSERASKSILDPYLVVPL